MDEKKGSRSSRGSLSIIDFLVIYSLRRRATNKPATPTIAIKGQPESMSSDKGMRGDAPFLIQDETPRDERVPRETSHENGATGIGVVIVAVNDIPTVKRWYEAVLDCRGEAMKRDSLGAAGLCFTVGPHRLELLAPASPNSPVGGCLELRGPSPFSATLRSKKEHVLLDPALTCGATISFG